MHSQTWLWQNSLLQKFYFYCKNWIFLFWTEFQIILRSSSEQLKKRNIWWRLFCQTWLWMILHLHKSAVFIKNILPFLFPFCWLIQCREKSFYRIISVFDLVIAAVIVNDCWGCMKFSHSTLIWTSAINDIYQWRRAPGSWVLAKFTTQLS